MEMEFPLTAVVGVSYGPTPKWNIEFDADYTDWSIGMTYKFKIYTPPSLDIRWTDTDVPAWSNLCDSRFVAKLTASF